MFNLSEYRTKPDRLADLLPWAALIDNGIVLNKDGSFLRTLFFRGPDLESATSAQLVALTARLNNALKRFGAGWALYIEANRLPYIHDHEQGAFKDPVSRLLDVERLEQFKTWGQSFESRYYLTLQFLPPAQSQSRFSSLFLEKPKTQREDANYHKHLEFFKENTERFCDILSDFMFEASFLDDVGLLSYLHQTISPKTHPIKAPEIPMYLDAFLADTPLTGGIAPKLGDYFIKTVSILAFPGSTFPAILDQLNQLPLSYRWVTRYLPLDKTDAEKELKAYKRKWFSKRKGVLHMLQEVFTKSESQLMDTAAVEKAKEADEALRGLSQDFVSYGYYTATVTVMDQDEAAAIAKQREIERVINGLGFTTIAESFNAVEAFLSSLPGQAYANVRAPLLHSLNLAHLIPFSAVWSGQARDACLNGPPLMYVHTAGRTPFRFVNHIGDVGHLMVVGPTGAGKSVFLCMMALQFRRYENAQVFVFDKGGSFLAPTAGVSGGYYEPGEQENDALVFQPLAHVDDEKERIWASGWLCELLINEGLEITPEVKQALWEALMSMASLPMSQRTLTGLKALVQNKTIRQALLTYTIAGPYGHLLDADKEMPCDEDWQCYEMESLMALPAIVAPVLSYLFHRLEKRFDGRPTLLILDEAWLFLDHSMFAGKIKDWLKSLRKKNVSVVFATQSVIDALNSSIAPALLESCPARVLLPNDRILEPSIQASYAKLGLNDRQLQILATATPKKQYYYQSRLGNRLFDLDLGSFALAFCAASRKEDLGLVRSLLEEVGSKGFLARYLDVRGLS